jgi:hypothetical protein
MGECPFPTFEEVLEHFAYFLILVSCHMGEMMNVTANVGVVVALRG